MSAKQSKRKYPVVEVIWGDAWSQDGWRDLESVGDEPMPCVSVGFMVKRDEDGITLAGGLSGTCANPVFFVPAGMVMKFKVLSA